MRDPDFIQIHALTPYPASCLVRGDDGRPKMVNYGGVDRARISSAALKRAVRTSDLFERTFEGRLGSRTRRIEGLVLAAMEQDGPVDDAAKAALTKVLAASLGSFGKVDEKKPGWIRQLAFIAPEEVNTIVKAVREVQSGQAVPRDLVALRPAVGAVDVGLFGRFFADSTEMRMTAAASVAHPFTVGRALTETDFFVAVDDQAKDEQDVAGAHIGSHFYTSGLFYTYVSIDMGLLTANLGGDVALAEDATAAFIEAVLTVSPSGKSTTFGTYSRAAWAMVERGASTPTSLAGAYLRPVTSEDQLSEAQHRAVQLASAFDRAYGTHPERRIMDVLGNDTTLADLCAIAHRTGRA